MNLHRGPLVSYYHGLARAETDLSPEYVDKLFTFVSVANVDPLTVNDDKIVTLLAIKLYALTSYIPELFIFLFIIY